MKKINFSFFSFREVLGLDLKILFHKNKEIERMLSKKMAFSLMSLITLFALAFAVPSVMAADEITPTLSADGDAYGEEIKVTLTFDKPVGLANVAPATAIITVMSVTNAGAQTAVSSVTITAKDTDTVAPGIQADDKTFIITIPASATTGVMAATLANDDTIRRLIVTVPKAIAALDPASAENSKAAGLIITLQLVAAPTVGVTPAVVSIQRLRPGSQTVTSAFREQVIPAAPFDIRIVLTEHPNGIALDKTPDENAKNLVEVQNGVPSNLVVGTLFERGGTTAVGTFLPHPTEGAYFHNLAGFPVISIVNADTVPVATSPDALYRQYRVTITPHQKKGPDEFDVKIRVKSFHDNGARLRNTYVSASFDSEPNGREALRIKVKPIEVNLKAGYRVAIPKEIRIPGGGYLVIAQNEVSSEVVVPPGSKKDAPKATERTPVEMLYNVIEAATLPNLATQFVNGVVVDVESGHGLVISEVMWGEDVSLNPSSNSQYIELYNPSAGDHVTPDDDASTADVDERLTLVFYAPNEFGDVPAATTDATTGAVTFPGRIQDRIGTLDATGAYWNPVGKGQSGRSGTTEGELTLGRGEFVDAVPIVSMYRGMVPSIAVGAAVGAMMPADGQMAASWMTSAGPKSANFKPLAIGVRHGTPGAATDATDTPADTAAEAKAKADAAAAAVKKTESTGTMPEDGQIYISEIMFAGGGILPQWIEISNGSRSEEINLSGWTLTVDNAAADADVSIGASATFTIAAGTTIDMSGQQKSPSTILVVTEAGRNNVDGSGQVLDLMKSNEVDLILAGVVTRKYTLLSGMAFMVTLAPPEPAKSTPPTGETVAAKATRQAAEKKAAAKRKAATDMVGNLGADGAAAWALPMSEDGRSSIIRRHVQVAIGAAAPDDGTMMDSWVLASETSFAAPTHIRAQSYYGAANDVGTPGFRAGGALPVELSHFRPARDKVTGAVVITWSTQSELNNAGFFIKRSQQRDGEFKVINATMIAGAGTISEKQFYTYNDTTARPNVVYYYQIEDVSLDGNRQTLTNGIRLKGHVSVAGKLTTLWGDLKTSQ